MNPGWWDFYLMHSKLRGMARELAHNLVIAGVKKKEVYVDIDQEYRHLAGKLRFRKVQDDFAEINDNGMELKIAINSDESIH